MEIVASSESFDEVVKRTRSKPETIRKAALRLGVKLATQTASDNQLSIEIGLRAKK
jgi:hypothetical protein